MEIQTGALVIVLAYMVGMMIIGYVVGKINIKGSADYLAVSYTHLTLPTNSRV